MKYQVREDFSSQLFSGGGLSTVHLNLIFFIMLTFYMCQKIAGTLITIRRVEMCVKMSA